MTKILALSTSALLAGTSALAHDGHGLAGSHWHASDTLGLLLIAVLAAAAVWSSGGRK
jgi:hypothetical protein